MHLGRGAIQATAQVKQTEQPGQLGDAGPRPRCPSWASLLSPRGCRDWLMEKASRGVGWREPGGATGGNDEVRASLGQLGSQGSQGLEMRARWWIQSNTWELELVTVVEVRRVGLSSRVTVSLSGLTHSSLGVGTCQSLARKSVSSAEMRHWPKDQVPRWARQ